jgi:hypothetical protein
MSDAIADVLALMGMEEGTHDNGDMLKSILEEDSIETIVSFAYSIEYQGFNIDAMLSRMEKTVGYDRNEIKMLLITFLTKGTNLVKLQSTKATRESAIEVFKVLVSKYQIKDSSAYKRKNKKLENSDPTLLRLAIAYPLECYLLKKLLISIDKDRYPGQILYGLESITYTQASAIVQDNLFLMHHWNEWNGTFTKVINAGNKKYNHEVAMKEQKEFQNITNTSTRYSPKNRQAICCDILLAFKRLNPESYNEFSQDERFARSMIIPEGRVEVTFKSRAIKSAVTKAQVKYKAEDADVVEAAKPE